MNLYISKTEAVAKKAFESAGRCNFHMFGRSYKRNTFYRNSLWRVYKWQQSFMLETAQ